MTKIIGHRGARGLAPENTLAALREALKHRVDEIEIGVRVTKDGVPVLVHDRFLRGAAGGRASTGRIAAQTLSDLRRLRPDLLTLEEAIAFVKGRVPLMIEVKPRIPVESTVELVQAFLLRGWQASDFLLASKSQRTLLQLHQLVPEVQKVVIERFSTMRARARARQVDTKRLTMNRYFLWRGAVASLHQAGYELYPYVLNNPRRADQWAKHGLAGLITDHPQRFNRKAK